MLRVLGILGLVLGMMARVVRAPLTALLGFPNIDMWDTVMLRGVIADLLAHPTQLPTSNAIFYPTGYPVLQLTPNLLDHLLGAPLAWTLPFPLSDSVWWLLVLMADGLAAHRLGRRLGNSEGAGWLATVAFLLSEPIAREANLHHAPQALVFWAPLLVITLLDLRERPSTRLAVAAGALLALGALSYWYLGVFLATGLPATSVGPALASARDTWNDHGHRRPPCRRPLPPVVGPHPPDRRRRGPARDGPACRPGGAGCQGSVRRLARQ